MTTMAPPTAPIRIGRHDRWRVGTSGNTDQTSQCTVQDHRKITLIVNQLGKEHGR